MGDDESSLTGEAGVLALLPIFKAKQCGGDGCCWCCWLHLYIHEGDGPKEGEKDGERHYHTHRTGAPVLDRRTTYQTYLHVHENRRWETCDSAASTSNCGSLVKDGASDCVALDLIVE